MPFEAAAPRRRIAVIGGGISGMGAAHMLAEDHEVTLIEAEPRLGGHARTIHCGPDGSQPVDTGFIVFNKVNYPHLVALFEKLEVPVVKSDMSFGASFMGGRLEYGLPSYRALFSQRSNAVNPRFLRMLRDILRFNARARDTARDSDLTIGGLMDVLRLGPWFREYYLLPFTGAIWSAPKQQILEFPAQAMIRFLENHALLSRGGSHQWWTVEGGSVSYVRRLGRAMLDLGVDIRLGTPVAGVRRTMAAPEVRMHGGEWEAFDEVVLATHSDDSLALLADPTQDEAAALGAVRYQPNRTVLHSDPALMPHRRGCWSSWNYAEGVTGPGEAIDLTYWMNSLQPIPHETPYFVTLNSTRPIREDLIHDETTFRHPVYDRAALAAQADVARMNGQNGTWFCGAWMRNGFHEDGLASAVAVAEGMARRAPRLMAAE
ncbi:NAD(P)/FAD-dependent oxidoreductase [Pseudooceanicola sp. LIPI14-2-Ac024]|uniref:NAD(P)/FAD-dependent oxidoreductase n=1 Tax=Pseudooceanicola sp. LIPI14-2-Ac024 TaxID=3344875 RepID=UPI0035D07011